MNTVPLLRRIFHGISVNPGANIDPLPTIIIGGSLYASGQNRLARSVGVPAMPPIADAKLVEMLEGLEGQPNGIIQVKCEQCNGKGAYSRGPYPATTCNQCGGKGFVIRDAAPTVDFGTIRSMILELQSLRSVSGGVVEPYAHEFGKSNGDGTYCVVIEKGPRSYADKFAVPDWPITPLYAHPVQGVGVREALERIRELNLSGTDANGQRWANSDLIEQEIVGALSSLTSGKE